MPFSGDKIYNPYTDIDSKGWKKANFHMHTHQWGGISNGRKNSEMAVDTMYHYLGYDIIGISDYQYINYYNKNQPGFVPAYEHGYMFPKNHQLVIGAKKVRWLDYVFPQTLNNKQYIINTLKSDSSCIVEIAHPQWRSAYSSNDFKYLSGYDCIGVYDRLFYSRDVWDSALSSGHAVYATSEDDNHDLTDPTLVGMNSMLINLRKFSTDSIMQAIRKGRTIACETYSHGWNDFTEKRKYAFDLPVINSVTFENNQLSIHSNTIMSYLRFIGQGGVIKKTVNDTKDATYNFKPEDTYIRTDIHFPDSTVYHLNPAFRYNGDTIEKPKAVLDETGTTIHRIFFYISLFVIFFILYISMKMNKYV